MEFSHLHVHSQYSLLDGAASIINLLSKAKENGMKSIALTDHGNMFGVPKFVSEAKKKDIKPIIGCEFYLARGSRHDKSKNSESDEKNIFHQLILAKNQEGYKNLAILSSKGFLEGYYYKPRIDKELIRQYRNGLIATTCCLASEINQAILKRGEEEAEKIFLEWLDIFGEDYYIELQRHTIEEQEICNKVLIKWAKKHNVKMIATNDVHYVNIDDSQAQDILLCLQTGKDYDDPNRMRFQNNHFFLKTKEEMEVLFADIPEALDNTQEISDKIETPKITRDVLLPVYQLPSNFLSEIDYLKFLSFEGAKKCYGEITSEVEERLNFELKVINDMGFAGYFLIVQDFTSAARTLGVSVGPGRGSAAGSLVAYCTGITNIDPIKYDLLFERFLNPERVSMPDIDIDFDEDGRQKVIDYVVDKYGKEKVAQIVTFGTMGAKSAIKDVARVLGLNLKEASRLADIIPSTPNMTFAKAMEEKPELKEELNSEDPLVRKTMQFAQILEGSARHTGLHAAGVIIAPDKLENYIPLCTAKDADLLVTQYDGKYIESVGMLKMDFLGLKTLSIINDCVELIKENRGITIIPDDIPLDDKKTMELYQRGETIGTFQFESPGMQNGLREMKPTHIEDLIAMNALYRPGPMQFLPLYNSRKHGKEPMDYIHEMLKPILEKTYGIMIYQEQIMQTAQIMGGFTLGGADLLRRAMGKKDAKIMEEQKAVFIKGAIEKNVDEKKAEEVFEIMKKFAEYGFNRSHSAAYSVLAFQTAYLKANFPAEYMASVLTRNMTDIKKITQFLDECKRMNLTVLGPDINESVFKFTVNSSGKIRFGLGAVKGVGENAVNAIVEERNKNGPYKSIFNLTARINLKAMNKKTLESLAYAGAFDGFKDIERSDYFYTDHENISFLEKAIRYGSAVSEMKNSPQINLFGETNDVVIQEPQVIKGNVWSKMQTLNYEKEVIGFYLSGHPLDSYKLQMESFCKNTTSQINDAIRRDENDDDPEKSKEKERNREKLKNKEVFFGGIITQASHMVSKKNGNPYGIVTIEDYSGTISFNLFSETYLKFKHLLIQDSFVYIMARIASRFNDDANVELKVINIMLLDEIIEKKTNKVLLSVSMHDISESFVNDLESVVLNNPGNTPFSILIEDKTENLKVEMMPKKHRILASEEVFKQLQNIKDLKIELKV